MEAIKQVTLISSNSWMLENEGLCVTIGTSRMKHGDGFRV